MTFWKKISDDLEKRRRIIESDFGRDCGWDVYLGEERIAELTEAKWLPEMQFWHEYTLRIATQDQDLANRMLKDQFWLEEAFAELRYINKEFGTVCKEAIPGPIVTSGAEVKISVRSLSVAVTPRLCDAIYSWWCQRRTGVQGQPSI